MLVFYPWAIKKKKIELSNLSLSVHLYSKFQTSDSIHQIHNSQTYMPSKSTHLSNCPGQKSWCILSFSFSHSPHNKSCQS